MRIENNADQFYDFQERMELKKQMVNHKYGYSSCCYIAVNVFQKGEIIVRMKNNYSVHQLMIKSPIACSTM